MSLVEIITKMSCDKCGHHWVNRREGRQGVCPKCHHYTKPIPAEILQRHADAIRAEIRGAPVA